MKQLIKYFLSFFSQHVELEQTIKKLLQDLVEREQTIENLQLHQLCFQEREDILLRECQRLSLENLEECKLVLKKSKLAYEKSKQLDYANMVISHNEQTIEDLTNNWFGEFCRASKADEAASEGEYSPEYFNKIFKSYKSQDEIRILTTSELSSIYFERGWCSMSKFRNELSLIQRSKATTPNDEAIRSLDILCRKKLIFKIYFGHSCGDKIIELIGNAI